MGTKICVITGASSSGKTTIINLLSDMGFTIMHEVARDVLQEGILHPDKDVLKFQKEVAKRHYEKEQVIRLKNNNEIIFLDRGMYDNVAFCKYFGLKDLPETLNKNLKYDAVFVLDQLKNFEHDGIRIEKNMEEALKIKNLIINEYQNRNIECVRVPVMSPEGRVNFILNYSRSFLSKV